ncbi:cytochrome P450 monooxygenase [Sporothrix schenckii 1099-18]|uniref:Cytochrome P450 n=2 Tax=Sporothrix schenckii TaxID=29908 RepID=U7PSG4_SPOS1|nr:cytochrome P450 monooxygenase [Sporothrix schenckii 1099-18]ERS98588.1 hypothetical protein HMPREF1624_05374 [Sporothrix schenckii ATCC 58251]KJR89235.1 cytochrome P450 monooxygenase [Sporothrix schenckii 1099-18]
MALISVPLLLGAAILATVLTAIRRLVSAGAAVPGPRLNVLSSLPLKYHEFRGQRTRYVHGLHRRYGSVVRLAPNEVAFASLPALKEIYLSNGSGYDKTEFYHLFRQYGTPTMFSTLDKQTHSRRRRILADRYANSSVVKEDALQGLRARAAHFTERAAAAPHGVLDTYIALHSYAFDGVTHHLFHPHGSDALRDAADEAIMREVSFDNSLARRLLEYYNRPLERVADALGLLPPQRSIPRAKQIVLDAVDSSLAAVGDSRAAGDEHGDSKAEGAAAATFTLLARLQDPSLGLTRMQMAAECMDHMAAGIETTGDVLCWLMWQLSLPASQAMQTRLYQELQGASPAPSSYDSLPYLHAVLKEGLRVFPSIPMSLPRYVPAGGREVDGTWLPAGTIVSCQPYTMHRFDEAVFSRPDAFDPERWLGADAELDAEMNRRFFAFSNGGRGCLGRHLAMAEMKLLLRDVYSQFQTVLAGTDGKPPADMSMSDQIISSRPKGQSCLLKFIPREPAKESL